MKDTKSYSIHNSGNTVSYTEIVEGEFIKAENLLRITCVSDTPAQGSLFNYINDRFSSLKSKNVSRVYYDEPWHFSETGVPYGIILIFFEDTHG